MADADGNNHPTPPTESILQNVLRKFSLPAMDKPMKPDMMQLNEKGGGS